jgi:flavin-dependent dehydrogenase
MAQWDVVVAGGGPAGAVCAIELVRGGHRVLVLDAELRPRYHVGESLSPSACSALESYGVDVGKGGYVEKTGATFVWGARAPFSTYYPAATAWQVRRAELDEQLLARAAESGVEVRSGCRVERVVFDGQRATGVVYRDDDGSLQQLRATWVVDATGRDALLARQRGMLDVDPEVDRHAIWAYWRGGRRLPGRAAGNALYVGGPTTWWYLPVDDRNDLIGVGLVRRSPPPRSAVRDHYAAAVAAAPLIRRLLAGARQVGPVRSASIPEQVSQRLAGPGWLAVGDAAGYVDPVLTPGVQLAIQSGQSAARTIQAAHSQPEHAASLFREYERRFRQQYVSYRRLADNLYTDAAVDPPAPSTDSLAGGDERTDRLTFMSVISGLPPDRLQSLLGAYMGMRGAAVRYGAAPPAFNEAEGFSFLTWALGRERTSTSGLTSTSVLRVADRAGITEMLLPAERSGDPSRKLQVAVNGAGDRFLATKELATLLLRVLTRERTTADAARCFAGAFGCAIDTDQFGRWMRLLVEHGLVGWRPAGEAGAEVPGAAESRV